MRRPRDQLGAGLGVLAALAVDILLASCACTFSETSARVCTNSDVLAFVVNRYNDANVRPEIVPSMAAQYPTAAPDTVLCTVYLRVPSMTAPSMAICPKLCSSRAFSESRRWRRVSRLPSASDAVLHGSGEWCRKSDQLTEWPLSRPERASSPLC